MAGGSCIVGIPDQKAEALLGLFSSRFQEIGISDIWSRDLFTKVQLSKATANGSVDIHVQGAYLISSTVSVSTSKLSARSEQKKGEI